MTTKLQGVLAAAVTPLRSDLEVDLGAVPLVLEHVAELGCHGAVVLGTTGEGPSLSVAERRAVIQTAVDWRRGSDRDFALLAGTGCANLPETVALTQAAFEAGVDGVLLLPPFYYKDVSAEGTTTALRHVIETAVPPAGRVVLYHISAVSGVPIERATIESLRTAFPERCCGIKDSSGALAHTLGLVRHHPGLAVLTGTDSHLGEVLAAGGVGAITALANVFGDVAYAACEARRAGKRNEVAEGRLAALREAVRDVPLVPAIKALLAERHGLPRWPVRPPLVALTEDERAALVERVGQIESA